MSYSPTNFKNEALRIVEKGLKFPFICTFPYGIWSNGDVYRLEGEVLRVFRSVKSELQMNTSEWPEVLPVFHISLSKMLRLRSVQPYNSSWALQECIQLHQFLPFIGLQVLRPSRYEGFNRILSHSPIN